MCRSSIHCNRRSCMSRQHIMAYRPEVLAHLKSWYFLGTTGCLLAVMVVMLACKVDLQWFWLLLFAAVTVPWAPWASDPVRFFRGGIVRDVDTVRRGRMQGYRTPDHTPAVGPCARGVHPAAAAICASHAPHMHMGQVVVHERAVRSFRGS